MHLAEAIAAINRPVSARFKGDFSSFAAFGASSREHLASAAIALATLFRLPCLTAIRTALGLIGIALGMEELLLFSAEREGSTAIGALE